MSSLTAPADGPSVTVHFDRDATPSASCQSLLPVELADMVRADGIPRTILCFVDEDGYISDLECVCYDVVLREWPDPQNCAVLLRDEQRYLEAVVLPSGVIVRPHQPEDRWVSFEVQEGGGVRAGTWSGHRECFAAHGTELSRVFTK